MAISSRYTRGIEIQIGGNATKLKTALDSANRSIRTTQSELDTLKNSWSGTPPSSSAPRRWPKKP